MLVNKLNYINGYKNDFVILISIIRVYTASNMKHYKSLEVQRLFGFGRVQIVSLSFET